MAVTTHAPNSGPNGGTRRTKVTRAPYWVPWDDQGEGGWRFLPIDRAHHQMVVDADEEGNATRPVDLYVHKGFLPLELKLNDEEAMAKLPTNWRDVANRGAMPEWEGREDVIPAKVEAQDSTEAARQHWENRAKAKAGAES